ncbi:biogenesis of lysosome- organelles complex 1 subunit 2 [Entomortierella chlamydospora]|uniref:Biogenesis of lysosome- organelles complex 1 subunit 2 n=1 Tax=Entomortierella chlamydospora TaxID=101097 RepID=A0A9P6MT91_9FUNG|nr:biogenesis of lysosome- organelles complex 1 subunit 2 [Entomortierella chlamydospora]
MSPPTKSAATMALSQHQKVASASAIPRNKSFSVSPTPSSSSSSLRAQSLQSSLSQQTSNNNNNNNNSSSNTFSAAEAAKHLSEEHVARTSQDMFRKIAEYVRGEMLATGEDYKLLENMNVLTKERYSELAVVAQELMQEVGKLRTTYSDFEPYLARIDEISQQAETISNIAAELDEYTKSLETRLKRVTK